MSNLGLEIAKIIHRVGEVYLPAGRQESPLPLGIKYEF